MSSKIEAKSAETRFREAFERLKKGAPEVLPKGSTVTQNNVAKEAGQDRTALKKARFPSLITEIQRWVDEHKEDAPRSERRKNLTQRKLNRSLKERLEIFEKERDQAQSLLVDADAKIIALTKEIADLEQKVARLEPTAKKIPLSSKYTKKDR